MKCKCDNCGHECDDEEIDLEGTPDLDQRLDPGSVVPAGECPKCKALTYLVKPPVALEKPLTIAQMRQMTANKDDAYIKSVVQVGLSEAIDHDLEGWLDIISEALCDNELLMDVNYKVVGHDGDDLLLEVSGDASMILSMADESEEGQ